MTINLKVPDVRELKPKIVVFGCGGAGGNAVNNMIQSELEGVEFVVANTDAQALSSSKAERVIQLGLAATEGLGAGSVPEVGRAAAEEVIDEVTDHLSSAHMVFITAGMGGGTGTGAAPVIARAARELGILTVGVVTKPFDFEGPRRMRVANNGIEELQKHVDTLIIIPNQNLFRVANERTTFADAFAMADQVLYSGVACITDLMVKEGLINLDFADVRSIMRGMGKAMMGTGEASGDKRALQAAEAAIANPLLDEVSMRGAKGLLISITGGPDMTLFEVDEAATRIREEVDVDANIILGATFDESLEGMIRVSVVATGIDAAAEAASQESAPLVVRKPAPRAAVEAPKVAAPVAPVVAATPVPVQASAPRMPAPMNLDLDDALVGSIERELALPDEENAMPAKAVRVSSDPAVSFKPYKPAEGLFDLEEEPVVAETSPVKTGASGPFIPPSAERPERATPRIPARDEFPPIAQAQMKARSESEEHDERGPMSILRKLAGIGLSHGETASERREPEARTTQRRAPEVTERAASSLDLTGRAIPADSRHEDDPMDIPAFLRRANKN